MTTVPETKQDRPETWKVSKLDEWAKKTLPLELKKALTNSTGKNNPNVTFEGEICFRHVLPHVLLHSGYFTAPDIEALNLATPLVVLYYNLLKDYAEVDPTPIKGYNLYNNFQQETDFHQQRIKLSSAALLKQGFDVQRLVRYIGGPHI